MAQRTLLIRRCRIVNHRDEPIAVSPDIKHNVSSNIVSIAKHAANFGEAVPSNSLYDSDPCLNFVCRAGILPQSLLQMFSRHNVHG
jgi:LEA14-like dessication related protein